MTPEEATQKLFEAAQSGNVAPHKRLSAQGLKSTPRMTGS